MSLSRRAGLCPPRFLSPPSDPKQPGGGPRVPQPFIEKSPAGKTKQEPADKRTETVIDRNSGATDQKNGSPEAKATVMSAKETPGASRLVPIGRLFERGVLGEPVLRAADLLPRHSAIPARSRSGQTV